MMITIVLVLCVVLAGLVFAERFIGFRAQRPTDYSEGPAFDIRDALNGAMLCDGVIYGPTGRVVSRFAADFKAGWDGANGWMTERFRYASGDMQERQWTLQLGHEGTITAAAPDLVGLGHGEVCGSAMRLRYRIRLDQDAGGHVLSVTDWMYMTPDGTLVNRSQFRKFGIKVGELVATIRKA